MRDLVDDEVLAAFAVVAEPSDVAAGVRERYAGAVDRYGVRLLPRAAGSLGSARGRLPLISGAAAYWEMRIIVVGRPCLVSRRSAVARSAVMGIAVLAMVGLAACSGSAKGGPTVAAGNATDCPATSSTSSSRWVSGAAW